LKTIWREYEGALIFTAGVSALTSECWKAFTISAPGVQYLADAFLERNISFNYYDNVLLPQIGLVAVLIAGYFWLSKAIVPAVTRLFWKGSGGAVQLIFLILQYFFLIMMLVVAAHVATYFAHPHFFNYGGWRILALFGYNELPFVDFSQTITHAVGLVFFSSVYLFIREGIIHWIETSTNHRYRILLANQIALILLLYFSIIIVFAALHIEFEEPVYIIFFVFVPPSIIVFFLNLYSTFPTQAERSLFTFRTIIKIVLIAVIGSIPFILIRSTTGEYNVMPLFITCTALQLIVITPLSRIYYLQRKDKINALLQTEIELKKSTADLQFLRSQINPHFLFNALNTLYGTAMRENAPDTVDGIQKLGEMMRFMLHENHQDFISLDKEVAYLQNYIALQQLRLTANTQVEVNIETHRCDDGKIIPMLLIPFVENAFKHGVSLSTPSWVKIALQCREKTIVFTVKNSLPAKVGHDPDKKNSGIGLENVRQRLHLFYQGKHSLSVGVHENEYIANLSIVLI
jgi:two-component system, LytTR family, sensor kinase